MPLFEVETNAHIIITWADDEAAAKHVLADAYPRDNVIRMTKRPRNTWVISKGALGLTSQNPDPATWPATAWPKRQATKCTRFGSTCTKRDRIWNTRGKPSNRTWSWAGSSAFLVGDRRK